MNKKKFKNKNWRRRWGGKEGKKNKERKGKEMKGKEDEIELGLMHEYGNVEEEGVKS